MADTLIAFPQAGKSGGQVVPIRAKDNGDGSYSIATNGNAMVPANAPIQPPQAFVDAFSASIANSDYGGAQFTAPNCGIVSFVPDLIFAQITDNGQPTIDLSGNSLTVASVNAILIFLAGVGGNTGSIDLSGGSSAAPTGAGATAKATMISAGWTVTTN